MPQWWVETGQGRIVMDASGARWFFPHGAEEVPGHVDELDRGPFVHRGYSSTLGVLLFTPDRVVLATKTPLGAAEPVATLPAHADPQSFRAFRDGFTVRAGHAMLASGDGHAWRPIRPPAESLFVDLLLGADGRGLSLFTGGKVSRTVDGGATWHALEAEGLTVETLDEERGRPLLRPGGARDGFARAVDLDSGKSTRDPSPPRFEPRRLRPLLRRSRPPSEEPERPRLLGGFLEGGDQWALDGDELFVLDEPRLLRGRLGEPLIGKQLVDPESCRPTHLAVCAGRMAIACGDHALLSKGDAPPLRVPLPPRAALAFDRRGALVLAFGIAGGDTVLRTHALDDPTRFTERPIDGLAGEDRAFVGGCHRPALWLATAGAATRIDPPAGDAVHSLPRSLQTRTFGGAQTADLLGVRADGQLVLGDGVGLTFLPSGRTFSSGPARRNQVSLAEDGMHGLWRQDVGALLQTADGGDTWAPIPSPAGDEPRIVCGAQRCLFGEGAFLDGFVKQPSYVPVFPPAQPVAAFRPAKLRCHAEAATLPKARGTLLSLSPRLGAELFAGLSGDPETAPGSARWAVFGDLDRRITTASLPPFASGRAAREGSFAQLLGTAGVVSVGRAHGGDDRRDRFEYRASARGPLTRTPVSLARATWVSDHEVAQPVFPGKLLVWGRDAPRELPFRTAERAPCPGVFWRDPSAGLLAAEVCEASLALFARDLDDVQIERDLVVRDGPPREVGVGLSIGGPEGRGVYLLESTAEGRPEIRFHGLSPSLALGPGVPVPGTLGRAEGLIDLQSCPANATGTLLRLATREPITIDTGSPGVDSVGLVQRLARVTLAGACIERTFVTEEIDLAAFLVVRGNGGEGVRAADAPFVRCEPLDPSEG